MSARRRPMPRRLVTLGVTVALVAGSAGAAFGYWVSTATATATATTASVAVSQTGFDGTGATYRGDVLTSTGSFTVTNTGQTAGTASLAIAATSGAAMAAAMPISVWQVASAASCTAATTVPGGATTGTWASWQASGVALAPGVSTVFCVRTVVPNRQAVATSTGAQSTTSTLTVTFDDAAGWVGTVSATGTATRATELIYPPAVGGSANYVQPGLSNWFTLRSVGTSLCLDVSGSGGTGTRAISWTCHQDANQRWEIIPDPANPGLVQLRPKHGSGLSTRLTVTGSAVTIATTNGSAAQLWEIQRVGDNSFQLVAHTTGQCLTMAATSGDVQIATTPCSASARASQTLSFIREPLTFTNGATVVFGFGANTGAAYRLQRLDGTTWTNVGNATGTAVTSLSVTRNDANFPPNATTTYRIVVNGTSTVVYSGIVLARQGDTITATAGIG